MRASYVLAFAGGPGGSSSSFGSVLACLGRVLGLGGCREQRARDSTLLAHADRFQLACHRNECVFADTPKEVRATIQNICV